MPDARTAILDAAEATFAREGFKAATIKTIGRAAGVNPALLYYYFPDKTTLYHAVLERRMGGVARATAAQLDPSLPPREAIPRLLATYAAMMHQAPHLPRLLARELADHEAAHALPIIREIAAGTFQRFCDLIRAGQKRGEVRADVEPRFAAISTIAQVAWFFVAQPGVSRLLGYEGAVPERIVRQYTDHAVRFALAALTTEPARRTSPRKRTRR